MKIIKNDFDSMRDELERIVRIIQSHYDAATNYFARDVWYTNKGAMAEMRLFGASVG